MIRSVALGAVGEFAASHHGAFTRSQAAAHELHRGAIAHLKERGVLAEPVPNVLVIIGAPATWEQRLYVANLAGSSPSLSIGASAGRLQHVDGFVDDPRLVVAKRRGATVRLDDVTVMQTLASYEPRDIVQIGPIACTGLARTVCDIYAMYGREMGERALDDFQRRGASLRWLEQTARRVQNIKGRGLTAMIDEIEARKCGGEVRGSWFEKLVELCLRSRHIPGLERQYSIRNAAGRFVARVDLAVPLVRLGIEAHSREFHVGPRREAIDQRRDNEAALLGWELTYIGYGDATMTPKQVCHYIERLVQRRATDLGIALPRAS